MPSAPPNVRLPENSTRSLATTASSSNTAFANSSRPGSNEAVCVCVRICWGMGTVRPRSANLLFSLRLWLAGWLGRTSCAATPPPISSTSPIVPGPKRSANSRINRRLYQGGVVTSLRPTRTCRYFRNCRFPTRRSGWNSARLASSSALSCGSTPTSSASHR